MTGTGEGAGPGAARRVSVAPERLAGWLDRFAERHGTLTVESGQTHMRVVGADGSVARLTVPFPPLVPDSADPYAGLVAHALLQRRVGVLLVRLGGHAAGVFEGDRLVVHRVGSRPVHGRSAAGGWSQQRFARRREGQVRVAHRAAADLFAQVLLPEVRTLDAVVVGGERRAVAAVLEDRRLAPLQALVAAPFLDVPDPRLRVLTAAGAQLRAVAVTVSDPG